MSDLDSIAAREVYGKTLKAFGEAFQVTVGVYDFYNTSSSPVVACDDKEVN